VVEQGLSVRQAEALARASASPEASARPRPGAASTKDADTRALEMDLSDAVGLPVEIEDRDGRGAVTIRYETLEQLDALCSRLSR
jgi:ParB family chromosome partitioning protein